LTSDCWKPPLDEIVDFGDPSFDFVLTVVPVPALPEVVNATASVLSPAGDETVPVESAAALPPEPGDEGDESDEAALLVPLVPSSAPATPAPLTMAAPTPSVSAPAPSHEYASVRRLPFRCLLLKRLGRAEV
jgi:hypothetical protein